MACSRPVRSNPEPLIQIRRGFRAEWKDMAFVIEGVTSQWTLRVEDLARRTLYTAERGAVGAARVAAAEYGIFRALGPASPVTPEHLAAELSWRASC